MGFHPLKTISAALPLDHLAIDLKEYPESVTGNRYCLVIVDICTRFVWLHALPNKEAKTIAIGLWTTIRSFGLPKIIQSDNGKEFVNKILKEMFQLASIDHRLITAYHARVNG
jgi:transposase InsO family protein